LSRPADRSLEIVAVKPAASDGLLRGGFLGIPRAGDELHPRDLTLRGWVLPEAAPALAVEFVVDGSVVGRTPVDRVRPDVEEVHGDLPHASNSGFEYRLDAAAVQKGMTLTIRAVLDPVNRVQIADLEARRKKVDADAVTVVIPCFRQAHFLPEAIESVLAQDHGAIEIVVVDDGSPDNVGEVAARYPGVKCLRRPNGGLAAARNAGLEKANGDFLLFLDADDRLLPEAISLGLEALRPDPEAMMAAGTWQLIGEAGEPLPADPPQQPPEAFPALLESCFISTPAAVLYRRELFREIGGFDPEVSASADYDLYLRTAARLPVRLHPYTVAEYRRHGANMTRDPELIMAAETAVLERQVPLVAEDPELREALRRGIERSRTYHGERLRLLAGDSR
jgi:Glycosyl transferase family 2